MHGELAVFVPTSRDFSLNHWYFPAITIEWKMVYLYLLWLRSYTDFNAKLLNSHKSTVRAIVMMLSAFNSSWHAAFS
jgi:hypothetical protein